MDSAHVAIVLNDGLAATGVACERLTQLDRLHRNGAIIEKRFGGGERLSDVRVGGNQ